jgi:hypothetical protein
MLTQATRWLPARGSTSGASASCASSSFAATCLPVRCGTAPTRIRQHTPAYASIRQHTSAYVSIRQRTSAYASAACSVRRRTNAAHKGASIRQHTPAYVSIRQHTSAYVSIRQHTSAYFSIPSAYTSIRQRTPAYLSIREHTSSLRRRTNAAHKGASQKVPHAMHKRTDSSSSYKSELRNSGCLSRSSSACGITPTCMYSIRQHTPAYVSIGQHTSVYVSIRQYTSVYVSTRQYTSVYVSIRQHTHTPICNPLRAHAATNSKIARVRSVAGLSRQAARGRGSFASAYVSIRQHTSAYVRRRRQRRSLYATLSLHT